MELVELQVKRGTHRGYIAKSLPHLLPHTPTGMRGRPIFEPLEWLKMFYVSEIRREAPEQFVNGLQRQVYSAFAELGITFERVDTDPGITMEDCKNIDKGIGGRIVKTIFLCNRQHTIFYIYVTSADKPFVTKDFGHALGIPRVSFASEEQLKAIVGTEHGASTILSACLDSAKEVNFVIDKEITDSPTFCCTDGTATCFVKISTSDLLEKYLPHFGISPRVI